MIKQQTASWKPGALQPAELLRAKAPVKAVVQLQSESGEADLAQKGLDVNCSGAFEVAGCRLEVAALQTDPSGHF